MAALNRALDSITGEAAVNICFGYTAVILARPSGYSLLPELKGCSCRRFRYSSRRRRQFQQRLERADQCPCRAKEGGRNRV